MPRACFLASSALSGVNWPASRFSVLFGGDGFFEGAAAGGGGEDSCWGCFGKTALGGGGAKETGVGGRGGGKNAPGANPHVGRLPGRPAPPLSNRFYLTRLLSVQPARTAVRTIHRSHPWRAF